MHLLVNDTNQGSYLLESRKLGPSTMLDSAGAAQGPTAYLLLSAL